MSNVVQQLMVLIGGQSDGLVATLDQTQQQVSGFAGKVNGILAGITFAGIGIGAVAAANKFDEAFVQIQRSTGTTGDQLKQLEGSFTAVYKQADESTQEVSSAISLIATRSQATGKDLENLTLGMLNLSKTQHEQVETLAPLVTRVFGDWSIATNRQASAMDYLRATSQQTGTQVSRLAEQVVYAGAPLRQLGYSFDQAVALIGKFEKEGVNTELVLGGMKAALQKFTAEGITDTAAAWQDFVRKVQDGSITFQQVAQEVGAKRAVDLYKAIQEGRFEIDNMVKSLNTLASQGGENVETMHEKFVKLQHQVEAVVANHYQLITAIEFGLPIVMTFGGALLGAFSTALPVLQNLTTAISAGLVGALTTAEVVAGSLAIAVAGAMAGITADVGLAKLQDQSAGKNPGLFGALVGLRTGLSIATNGAFGGTNYNFGAQPAGHPAADYVKSLPAPAGPAPGVGGGGSRSFTIQESINFDQLGESIGRAKKALEEFFGAHANIPPAVDRDTQSLDAFRQILSKTGDELNSGLLADFSKNVLGPIVDKQLRELPGAVDAAAIAFEQTFTPDVLDAANNILLMQRNAEAVTDAFHYFGLQTPEEMQAATDQMEEQYQILKDSGLATAEQLDRAFIAYKLHQIELDHELGNTDDALYAQQKKNAEDALAQIDGKTTQSVNRRRRDYYDLGQEMEQMAHRTFDSIEHSLAQDIVQWKGWSDTIKNIGQQLAEDFLSIMLKGLFKPLEDEFAKVASKIGGWLGGIFGGGGGGAASSAAGTVASSAGSIGGSAAGAVTSGLGGILNTVFSGISAATGVFSIFQNMHQETSLNAIEHNTRYLQIEAEKFFQVDEWDRHYGLLAKFDMIFNRLGDMWDTLRGMSAGGSAITFNNCNFGAGLTQQQVNAMFNQAMLVARAAGVTS